jgi:excisionase family DNA binding protein
MTLDNGRDPQADAGHEPPLTIPEAAVFLNVTERWIRRAVQERRLPYMKLGHHVRLMPEDLREYLRSKKVEPPQPPTPSLRDRIRPLRPGPSQLHGRRFAGAARPRPRGTEDPAPHPEDSDSRGMR